MRNSILDFFWLIIVLIAGFAAIYFLTDTFTIMDKAILIAMIFLVVLYIGFLILGIFSQFWKNEAKLSEKIKTILGIIIFLILLPIFLIILLSWVVIEVDGVVAATAIILTFVIAYDMVTLLTSFILRLNSTGDKFNPQNSTMATLVKEMAQISQWSYPPNMRPDPYVEPPIISTFDELHPIHSNNSFYDGEGYVLTKNEGDGYKVVVVFRGTEMDFKDIFTNLRFLTIGYTCSKSLLRLITKTISIRRVHRGVLGAYLDLAYTKERKNGKKIGIHSILDGLDKPIKKIYVTGHSLGGAMATICALDLIERKSITKENLHMINFGSPRVGNYWFVRYYRRKVVNSWHLANTDDPVPYIYPRLFIFRFILGYRHIPNGYTLIKPGEVGKFSPSYKFSLLWIFKPLKDFLGKETGKPHLMENYIANLL